MQKSTHVRRLPLQGALNTRDLGGYACLDGVTQWRKFIRSATTHTMTPQDINALQEYGIDTIVDLRSAYERDTHPSALEGKNGFDIVSVPLLDQMNSSQFEGDLPGSMSGLYISLLDNNTADFTTIFDVLTSAKGGALFHCTAGKDRTGVVAMLLLGLVGVNEDDIISDYSITEIYMKDVFLGQLNAMQGQKIPNFVFRSMPESMQRVLQHLGSTYGTAEEYLLKAGCSAAMLKELKHKFTQAF